jgi:hypothetical protein
LGRFVCELPTEFAKAHIGNRLGQRMIFEHASHVAMSVSKLLSRIVNPKEQGLLGHSANYDPRPMTEQAATLASDLHDHTFGITSDPLTAFAAFFAALIHDG